MSSHPSHPWYQLEIGLQGLDDDWDRFVDSTRGGHHVQSSRWADVKAVVGMRGIRVVARRDGAIVGGCQVLLRRVPVIGNVAYVPKGPVTRSRDAALADLILRGVDQVAADEGVSYLKLQPPDDGEHLVPLLVRRRFRASSLSVAPTSTFRLDVRRPLDEILGGFRASVRSNIRKAERKHVHVRPAKEQEVPLFCSLVEATGRRQRFSPYPARYYEAIWRSYGPGGHARMLLAERGSEILAGILLVGFAGSVIYKIGGWSGVRTNVHPNELLHWSGIRWASEAGFRYYDMEGIEPSVADALAKGEELPPEARHGFTHFKLGFGGEVAQFPGAYDFVYRPLLRPALKYLAPGLNRSLPLIRRMVGRG